MTRPSEFTICYLRFTISFFSYHTHIAIRRQMKFREHRGFHWPRVGDDKPLSRMDLHETHTSSLARDGARTANCEKRPRGYPQITQISQIQKTRHKGNAFSRTAKGTNSPARPSAATKGVFRFGGYQQVGGRESLIRASAYSVAPGSLLCVRRNRTMKICARKQDSNRW